MSILDRLLDPLGRCLTPEAARRLLELRADPVAQARIDELVEKCNQGESALKNAPNTKCMLLSAPSSRFFSSRRGPSWPRAPDGHPPA